MSRTAIATLQTPWDCKWSRFGRMDTMGRPRSEGLWVCVYPDGTRRPIGVTECETCAHWQYEPPAVAREEERIRSATTTAHRAGVAATCPHLTRSETRLEGGVRVAAFVLAIVFAATGVVVLTRPLAIPLTVTLWAGAVTSFLLGVWGNFARRTLPERSW